MNSHMDKPSPRLARWSPAASRGRMRSIQGTKGMRRLFTTYISGMYEFTTIKSHIVGKDLSDISAHSSRHPRRIRQSDGTASVCTNPCSPFFVMYRQLCPELWACSLGRLTFKLLHCESGYFSNQRRLARLIVRPKSLDHMRDRASNSAVQTKVWMEMVEQGL
jgi:hypothetical protein